MKTFNFPSILFVLISFFGLQTPIFAQTMDNPMPLAEGQLTVNSGPEVQDYYYTFDAQVGEIVITGDGMGSAGVFFVGLLTQDFKTIKLFEQFLSGTPTRRTVQRFTIGKAQKVILKVKAPKRPNASLKLRIEGAVQFGGSIIPPSQTPNSGVINTNNVDAPQTTPQTIPETTPNPNTEGNPVQTSGTNKVTIVLKNGQVIVGSYMMLNIINNIGNKLTLTVRGKELPKFNPEDVKSITIE